MAVALVAAAGLTTLGGATEAQARGCGPGWGGGWGGGGWGYGPRPVVVARPVVPVNYGFHRGFNRGFNRGPVGFYGAGYRGGFYGGRGVSIGFGF